MKWRNLLARRWAILALVIAGLCGAAAFAQAAGNPFFFQTTDKDKGDEYGWLGVYIQDIDEDLAESEDLPSTDGVMVNAVIKGSPAEDAGLKKGDVILRFDGQDARSTRRLTRLIEGADPGSKVDIDILRNGSQTTLVCEMGSDEETNWSDDSNFDWSWSTPAPSAPDAPDAPRAPRAYSFSLGQLSSSYIGVGLYDMSEQLATEMGAADGGALINEVEKDSPAEKAGLKAGDVIVEVDHRKVYDTDDVRKAIQRKKDGESVAIRVLRGKSDDRTVDVTVESNDTWSGIGAPQHFRMHRDNVGTLDLPGMRRSMRESMLDNPEWREELREEMQELKKELDELRRELKDLR